MTKQDETSSTDDKNLATWRVWMRDKATMLKIYATCIAAVLSVIVGWNTLDWPTPAWSTDLKVAYTKIAEVKHFARGTRALVLDQAWYRIKYHLDDVETRLRQTPDSVDLRDLRRNLKRQLSEMDRQLKEFRQ